MKIEPFLKVGRIEFGLNRSDVLSLLGATKLEKVTSAGKTELDYGNVLVRFCGKSQKLNELTIEAENVTIGSKEMTYEELAYYIGKDDPNSFHKHGFVFSPLYGLMFDPNQKPYLTAFDKQETQCVINEFK